MAQPASDGSTGAPPDLLESACAHRDAGRFAEAAAVFATRAASGRDEEETWYARWQESRCLLKLGNEEGFLQAAMDAINRRPRRAEPFYDLAQFYRLRGMHASSVAFAEQGLTICRPADGSRFIDDHIYAAGIREEFSISANYAQDPRRKQRGQSACNWLALNRDVSQHTRWLARWNLFFYCQAAGAVMPSFSSRPIAFRIPPGLQTLSASVARLGSETFCLVALKSRDAEESRDSPDIDGAIQGGQCFILQLNDRLDVIQCTPVIPSPLQLDFAVCPELAESHLFSWQGALWCVCTDRPAASSKHHSQLLARVSFDGSLTCQFSEFRTLWAMASDHDHPPLAPHAVGRRLRLLCGIDPAVIFDQRGQTLHETSSPIAAEHLLFASQAIAFEQGWLALTKEASDRQGLRRHVHRFVWFNQAYQLKRISHPFFLHNGGDETCGGLCWNDDVTRLLLAYWTGDGRGWIGMIQPEDVRNILEDAENLNDGVPDESGPLRQPPTPVRISLTPSDACKDGRDAELSFPGADIRVDHQGSIPDDGGNPLPATQSIDVAMSGGLGDVLMCTPALRALKKREPGREIRFYTQYPDVVLGLPYIDEVHPLNAAPAGTIFVGYGPSTPPYSHIAQVIGDTLGVQVDDVRPDCIIEPQAIRQFQQSWAGLPRPHIVFCRHASAWTPNKTWPGAHWHQLLGRLATTASVIEIGWQHRDPESVPQNNYIDLVGRTSLAEFVAAVAAADLYIGPISGPMHVAAAAGKPSVVISGGYEHPSHTLYPGNQAFYTPVACAPCWLREPCLFDRRCLDLISAEMVEAAVWDAWSRVVQARERTTFNAENRCDREAKP